MDAEIKDMLDECLQKIKEGDAAEAYVIFSIAGAKIMSSPNKKELVKKYCNEIIKIEKFLKAQ